jgi:hypothetical protein
MNEFYSNTDRSGTAAESWVAYAMGINDFDVGQMIGKKAQSTDLLVSKDRKLWRIEVKSSSQGRSQAKYFVQNPIDDDSNLIYAFVFFDIKKKKQKLDPAPQLFFVKSTDLKKLKYEISRKENENKDIWIVSHKDNFWIKGVGSDTIHRNNWDVFNGQGVKERKKPYFSPDTDKEKIIRSYHRLFLNGMRNKEIRELKDHDLTILKIKEKLDEGKSISSITRELKLSRGEVNKIKERCKIE